MEEYIKRESLIKIFTTNEKVDKVSLSFVRAVIKNAVPAADVVSKDLYEQIKWERDAALAQLKDYGVFLGEKADVVEVVRCKDCKYYAAMITDTVSGNMETAPWGICTQPWFNSDEYDVQENGYCSYGKRKMDKEE